jgi:hypothetical protein
MKNGKRRMTDDLRPEYDLAALGPGVRGKYAGRLARTTLVALEPELAAAFPTSEAVNDALRAVLRTRPVGRLSTATRSRGKASRVGRRK